jgi:hypothetical protein
MGKTKSTTRALTAVPEVGNVFGAEAQRPGQTGVGLRWGRTRHPCRFPCVGAVRAAHRRQLRADRAVG